MTDIKHPLFSALEDIHNLRNFLLYDAGNCETNHAVFLWPTAVSPFKLRVVIRTREAYEEQKQANIKFDSGCIYNSTPSETDIADGIGFILNVNKTLFVEPVLEVKASDIIHSCVFTDRDILSGFVCYSLDEHVVEVSLCQLYLGPTLLG